jgi:hypothetical protein
MYTLIRMLCCACPALQAAAFCRAGLFALSICPYLPAPLHPLHPAPCQPPIRPAPASQPAAIKFMTYEQLSRKISHHLIDLGGDGQLTPLLRLTAGAGARGGVGPWGGLRDVPLQAQASSACEPRLA